MDPRRIERMKVSLSPQVARYIVQYGVVARWRAATIQGVRCAVRRLQAKEAVRSGRIALADLRRGCRWRCAQRSAGVCSGELRMWMRMSAPDGSRPRSGALRLQFEATTGIAAETTPPGLRGIFFNKNFPEWHCDQGFRRYRIR
jgi:hypothetical protein